MEKQAKPKNRILKFLPKAASAVTFQNPPFSPSRDKRPDNLNKLRVHTGKGFSGPIISIIPDEARRKPKNEGFESQEPTSPKVSCMGQIKHRKKIAKAKRPSQPQDLKRVSSPREGKKPASRISKMFSSSKLGRKSNGSDENKATLPDRAPSLGQMKKFSSGRDALAGFDWSGQLAPADAHHRNYYSDEERGYSDEEEEETIIPFSAPMMVGGGVALQPRKEVNLWKRRTMNPPQPLRLNTMVTAN